MNIVVYLQKQEFRVTIDSRATLDELCAKLEKLTFIPPHYQKLRLDLNDDLIVLLAGTLQNSGVKDGATLYLEADEKFFMSLPPKLTDSINTTGTTQRNTSALPTIDEFEQYDCEQLCSWLSRMKLSEYTVKQCREEEVDGRALLGYTPKQLVDDLKLKSGASQSITNLLEKIRSQTATTTPMTTSTTPTTMPVLESQKGGLRDGRYIKFESLKLGDMIGCGGEASVFVGIYCGEEYAVKRILKYKSTELDTILLFDHPCLMKCHYWTDDFGCCYYLMDQMETTLNDAIHGQLFPLSDEDKLKVMQDIARGCCYMHEKKVIHKDLKPSNILLRRNGSSKTIMAKISDFGISRAKRNESNISITYGLSGTIPYLPIEFLQSQESEHVYGDFTDVYAFGVILFEILFQEVPWKGLKSADQIVCAMSKGDTLLGKRSIPENWKGVGDIMIKCLGKREDRPTFQSIEKELANIVLVNVTVNIKESLSGESMKIIDELGYWMPPLIQTVFTTPTKNEITPDMRFTVNKQLFTPTEKNDGSSDLTYTVEKELYGNSSYTPSYSSPGPTKKDGTPDRRFAVNKELFGQTKHSGSTPTKKDGSPDMRFSVNKELYGNSSHSPSSSKYSSPGPTKKDGTPDMRYSSNKSSGGKRK
jgi:serine/threonine protein kinase